MVFVMKSEYSFREKKDASRLLLFKSGIPSFSPLCLPSNSYQPFLGSGPVLLVLQLYKIPSLSLSSMLKELTQRIAKATQKLRQYEKLLNMPIKWTTEKKWTNFYKCILPRLNQKTENMNRPITSNESKLVTKSNS